MGPPARPHMWPFGALSAVLSALTLSQPRLVEQPFLHQTLYKDRSGARVLSTLRGSGWWQGFKTAPVAGKPSLSVGLAAFWDVNTPTVANFQVAHRTPLKWTWEETHTIKCHKRVGARSSPPLLPGNSGT